MTENKAILEDKKDTATQTFLMNHVGTLLSNKEESYIMDSANHTVYLIYNNIVYPCGNMDDCVDANLKTEFGYEKREIPKLSSSNLHVENLLQLYKDTRLLCDDCFYTFQRFYLGHRELYEEIVNNRNELLKKYEKIKSLI